MPEPTPRPLRILRCVAPRGFASLLKVSAIVDLFHTNEVEHLPDRPAERRRVRHDDRRSRPFQAEPLDGRAHRVLLPDGAADLLHTELRFHWGVSRLVCDLRSAGRISPVCLPRLCATSSTLRRLRRACTVARTTLWGLVLPRHFVRMSWMPALSTTARTAPPAMTPVPCEAGF